MFKVRLLLVLASLWSSSVLAGPILQIENNKLIGVKDVTVGSHFYDVSFVQGSCVEVFNGCTSFPFELLDERTNPNRNLFAALQSLHKAIYGTDDLETEPMLWHVPELKIPSRKWYGLADQEAWHISYARFFNDGGYGEYSLESNLIEANDLWTVWSNARPVPEPSGLMLVITTLLAGYFFRRNKQRQQ